MSKTAGMLSRSAAVESEAEDLNQRMLAVERRLFAFVDWVVGSRALHPALLQELGEFLVSEAAPVAEAFQRSIEARWGENGEAGAACSYSCWASYFHCPLHEPLDRILEQLKEAGYEPYQDDVEESAARETRCLCGEPMSYVGLQRGRSIVSRAVCLGCWHWREL